MPAKKLPELTRVEQRQAQSVLDLAGGDRKSAALALLGVGWTRAAAGVAVGRSTSWISHQVSGRRKGQSRVSVKCGCGWVGERQPDRATDRPCPDCHGERGELSAVAQRQSRFTGERKRVSVYMSEDLYRKLAARGSPATIAGRILARWANTLVHPGDGPK